MTDKQIEEQIQAIRKLREEVKSSKKKARELLIKVGICTKSGKLTKAYR